MTVTVSLEEKVALVTGGAGGMGRAIVARLAEAGARVVSVDRVAPDVGQAGLPNGAVYVQADVSDASEVEGAVAVASLEFGRLDCAVNAAAIEFEQVPLHECDDADFDRMMSINTRSVFLCMKHELKLMIASGNGGSIVNIASSNAFRPQPNQPAYTASKHAVLGLTRGASIDYAKLGIRINAVCPGTIDTPMLRNAIARRERDPEEVKQRLNLFGRFGEPIEIANAALFLCSDASSFTTGAALTVDGGMLFH